MITHSVSCLQSKVRHVVEHINCFLDKFHEPNPKLTQWPFRGKVYLQGANENSERIHVTGDLRGKRRVVVAVGFTSASDLSRCHELTSHLRTCFDKQIS